MHGINCDGQMDSYKYSDPSVKQTSTTIHSNKSAFDQLQGDQRCWSQNNNMLVGEIMSFSSNSKNNIWSIFLTIAHHRGRSFILSHFYLFVLLK